jgi:hypothetical protein
MSLLPSRDQLSEALVRAGAAHHEYETRYLEGVRDEQWPGWYAAYVLGRLGEFTSPTQLAIWLEEAPYEGEWAPAAAEFVLAELARD